MSHYSYGNVESFFFPASEVVATETERIIEATKPVIAETGSSVVAAARAEIEAKAAAAKKRIEAQAAAAKRQIRGEATSAAVMVALFGVALWWIFAR